jgi:hypothetical protein
MGWATFAIEKLKNGHPVIIRPRGNSMAGLIKSGSLVEIKPLGKNSVIAKHDIVLCRVKGREYLHLVGAIQDNRYLIQNNRGHINGWITRDNIYGIYVKTISGKLE